MRAVRFSAELGFKIEKSTSDSILKNRQLLSDVSKERLQVEFTKLITGKYATDVIRKYHAVIEVFIPELAPLVECEQHTKYHKYDVFEHTLHAVDAIDFNDRIFASYNVFSMISESPTPKPLTKTALRTSKVMP